MTLAIELNVYPEQFERIVEMTLADFKACVEQLKMDEEAFNRSGFNSPKLASYLQF